MDPPGEDPAINMGQAKDRLLASGTNWGVNDAAQRAHVGILRAAQASWEYRPYGLVVNKRAFTHLDTRSTPPWEQALRPHEGGGMTTLLELSTLRELNGSRKSYYRHAPATSVGQVKNRTDVLFCEG